MCLCLDGTYTEDSDSEVWPGRRPQRPTLGWRDGARAGAFRGHRKLALPIVRDLGRHVVYSDVFQWLPVSHDRSRGPFGTLLCQRGRLGVARSESPRG